MSLLSILKPKGKNGFGYGTTAEEVTRDISLAGKNILITGCNSGLGFETARVLSMRGARIIGTARTQQKAAEACASFGPDSEGLECELSDPASVHACVNTLKRNKTRLDVIICNAGIMALPELRQAHGYELQFFTNHMGHFILVTGLLDLLADDGRVVILSSGAHSMAPSEGIQFDNLGGEKNYKPWIAYGHSKFANILFAKELARRFEGTRKVANAVHPGVIQTNLGRHMNSAMNFVFGLVGPLLLKTVQQGAATQCYAAVHPDMTDKSGHYLADCNIASARPDADNPELAAMLWKKSEEIAAAFGSGASKKEKSKTGKALGGELPARKGRKPAVKTKSAVASKTIAKAPLKKAVSKAKVATAGKTSQKAKTATKPKSGRAGKK